MDTYLSPLNVSLIVLGSMFLGVLLGWLLRPLLPEHHFLEGTTESVKLSVGLIVTLSALVISLMVSSAKNSFDSKTAELNEISSNIVMLDRTLAQYGPETEEARAKIRSEVEARIHKIWENGGLTPQTVPDNEHTANIEGVQNLIVNLAPKTDAQRLLQSQALSINQELSHSRWLLDVQYREPSIPKAFLVVLNFWLIVVFGAFSLLAPRNTTVTSALLVCAVAVSCALFLILELETPYNGIIKLSSAPMTEALSRLGK